MKMAAMAILALLSMTQAFAKTSTFKAEIVCPIAEGQINFSLTENRIQTVFNGEAPTELTPVKLIYKGPGYRRIFETTYSVFVPAINRSVSTKVRMNLLSFRATTALNVDAYNPETKSYESMGDVATGCVVNR